MGAIEKKDNHFLFEENKLKSYSIGEQKLLGVGIRGDRGRNDLLPLCLCWKVKMTYDFF